MVKGINNTQTSNFQLDIFEGLSNALSTLINKVKSFVGDLFSALFSSSNQNPEEARPLIGRDAEAMQPDKWAQETPVEITASRVNNILHGTNEIRDQVNDLLCEHGLTDIDTTITSDKKVLIGHTQSFIVNGQGDFNGMHLLIELRDTDIQDDRKIGEDSSDRDRSIGYFRPTRNVSPAIGLIICGKEEGENGKEKEVVKYVTSIAAMNLRDNGDFKVIGVVSEVRENTIRSI